MSALRLEDATPPGYGPVAPTRAVTGMPSINGPDRRQEAPLRRLTSNERRGWLVALVVVVYVCDVWGLAQVMSGWWAPLVGYVALACSVGGMLVARCRLDRDRWKEATHWLDK